MAKFRHIPIFRRRREGKTNYHKRRKLVISRQPFLYVFVSNKNITAQITVPEKRGDRVIVSVHSRELLKYGWRASRKSTPAAYLVGYLIGKKALKAGVTKAVLYTGVKGFTPGSRVAAVAKGARDAGLNVPASEDVLPSEDRIKGLHIVEYAKLLKSTNASLYEKRFSGYVSSGFDPEKYPEMVEEVKTKIEEAFKP